MELKNDRLTGAKAIGDFMGEDPRRIFYLPPSLNAGISRCSSR